MTLSGRPKEVEVIDLGLLSYREAWTLQQGLFERRLTGQAVDTLFLVEHPPTVTIGRAGGADHLRVPSGQLQRQGVELHAIDRGGDVTFHGPGQVVGYPILDLAELLPDLHRYVRALEEVMIRVVGHYGVRGDRIAGLSGVWVEGEKIAAIGVKVKRWITMHGFALNVNADLAGFELIVPCGIRGRSVTSLERLLGRTIDLAEARRVTARCFSEVFELRLRYGRLPVSPLQLPQEIADAAMEAENCGGIH